MKHLSLKYAFDITDRIVFMSTDSDGPKEPVHGKVTDFIGPDEEVGPMYIIVADDDTIYQAFEDELTKEKP